MTYLLAPLISLFIAGFPAPSVQKNEDISPLTDFSDEWNDPKYQACNTAAEVEYLSDEEKNVIYILNLARYNPRLFANTVVKQYPEYNDNAELINITYYQSLLTEMRGMKRLGLLKPDESCYISAECHAYNAGLSGAEGHVRTDSCSADQYYNGECCDYGHRDPLDIVMSLLIDYGVPSLGHRRICFNNYKFIGVAIQPHKRWDTNAVLDFHY